MRSPTSSARAEPATSAISSPARTRSPSRLCAATRTLGSSCRNASNATSSPASTQSAFTRNTPRACCAAGTVASVVTSPAPTSSSSARGRCRDTAVRGSTVVRIHDCATAARGPRCRTVRLVSRLRRIRLPNRLVSCDHNRARLADGRLERLHAQRRPAGRPRRRHQRDGVRVGRHRHLRDRHLQRLLGFRPLLAHLEQHVGRPVVDRADRAAASPPQLSAMSASSSPRRRPAAR